MKKSPKYIVQCLKDNRNKFGFGAFHKSGQFVMYNGKGTFDINKAYVYSHSNPTEECPLTDLFGSEEYYRFVPVVLKIVTQAV